MHIDDWLGKKKDPENNYPLLIESHTGVGKKTLLVKWIDYHNQASNKVTQKNFRGECQGSPLWGSEFFSEWHLGFEHVFFLKLKIFLWLGFFFGGNGNSKIFGLAIQRHHYITLRFCWGQQFELLFRDL
jgi:hypothetical protein